jgi:hypothetical protein
MLRSRSNGVASVDESCETPTLAEDERLARQVFARFGDGSGPRILEMVRLTGFTNRVYAVDTPDGRFCLRIPGAGTAEIIDRAGEAANARRAAAAGVAPPLLYFDADGIMVTPFLGDTRTLSGPALPTATRWRARPQRCAACMSRPAISPTCSRLSRSWTVMPP